MNSRIKRCSWLVKANMTITTNTKNLNVNLSIIKFFLVCFNS